MFSTGSSPANSARAPSIISADVVITGVLTSTGDIHVDGRVDGDVRCAGLVVGEGGTVAGDVRADTITVRGRVEGSVKARAVTIARNGHVEGDIEHEVLEVEPGAFVQGTFRHIADTRQVNLPEAQEFTERRRPGSPMREATVETVPTDIAPLKKVG